MDEITHLGVYTATSWPCSVAVVSWQETKTPMKDIGQSFCAGAFRPRRARLELGRQNREEGEDETHPTNCFLSQLQAVARAPLHPPRPLGEHEAVSRRGAATPGRPRSAR